MQTREFAVAVDELLAFGEDGRVAVMCAEAVWWQCHRMLLSDGLVAKEIDVQHILAPMSVKPHRMTPFAQLRDDRQVWYPGLV